MIEQTLSIIKPDAVERNLEDKIKSYFEKKIFILLSKFLSTASGLIIDKVCSIITLFVIFFY